MAVPLKLPDYEEETEINNYLIETFFQELYHVLYIYLCQYCESSSELVYLGRLPGLTVRVGVRPVIPASYSASQHELQPQATAVVPLPDIVPKTDTSNNPEGGTT